MFYEKHTTQMWTGTESVRTFRFGKRLKISIHYRPSSNGLGRFGGGWQWEVGFIASRGFKTIILNCLVFYIRIERGIQNA